MHDLIREKIDNWVSDFCQTDAIRRFTPNIREVAEEILTTFLLGACDPRGIEPGDIEQSDIRDSLLGPVAKLAIADKLKPEVPELCGALLSTLETQGRLSGGCGLGAYAHALREAYLQASSGKQKPITRPGSKIGRNDPCPCGSGRKYKKCCMLN
ncbi:MAG: SEC-C metal-binding domain-containing protein [Phycisphaerales bacterium]|nr:SEC-C metal-binding domain-containing protein [Phycisphaerales bacterium]